MNETFLRLTRELLDDEYKSLNPEQRQAVFSCDRPLLILAGAGSGKTTVVVNKIGYLIKYGNRYNSNYVPSGLKQEHISFLQDCLKNSELKKDPLYKKLMAVSPLPPYNILAITFTNKAAGEMRDRLQHNFDINSSSLWALTFHGTCVRILRKHIGRLGYRQNFTIYDDNDSNKLIESCIKTMGLNDSYNARAIKGIISKAKGMFLSPELFAESYSQEFLPKIPAVYSLYQKELKNANALDFDDLIFYTVQLLSENKDILEEVRNRFKYILVDEYQDTNPLQYRLISLLVSNGKICVVGDDDQSIYRFMGATIENILKFESHFNNAQIIRLEQNYRSTQVILDAANAVIANNTERKGKNLWTAQAGGRKIKYNQLPTQNEEGDYIAKTILTEVSSKKLRYNNFCVLYRTHAQSNSIETALKGNGIPYKICGGLAFYKRKEIQDMLAYLNVINNPYDMTRLMRIINEPKRGIGDTTIEKINELSNKNGMHFFDILKNADDFTELQRCSEKLKSFADMIEEFQESLKTKPLSEVYIEIYEKIGYSGMLQNSYNLQDAATRTENIKELLSSIIQFEQTSEDKSLLGFLEQTALISAVDNLEEDGNAVILMTMHCAKGLEFDTVFIAGFEEGLFPSAQSINEQGGIEEERRLCYVAITRAKKQLFILSTCSRLLYGNSRPALPSRFLKEIPNELLEETKKPFKENIIFKPEKQVRTKHILTNKVTSIPQKQTKQVFKVGQRVKHRTFGEGIISIVTAMSSDTLLEVNFATQGKKKLMANFAKLEVLD